MSVVLREQREEMTNTFANIRQKIADAQVAIRNYNNQTERLLNDKEDVEERCKATLAKCSDLRNQIADKERDLWDVENQIPLAKSKIQELESMCGENRHFEKMLQRTHEELEQARKEKEEVHWMSKQKSEDVWHAKQKLHKLEVRVEEVDKKIEFSWRRIIVAQERIAAVDCQTSSVSRNYKETSKSDMENNLYELQLKVNDAKARRQKMEEQALKLTWRVEELEKELQMYYQKMKDMYSGQRELSSSKLL